MSESRYRAKGISGLTTRPRWERKAELNDQTDLEQVQVTVQQNRHKLSLTRAHREADLGKEFSAMTLK